MWSGKIFRPLYAAAALVLLQGCGGGSNNPNFWSQYLQLVNRGFGAQAITLDQAAKIPYASLAYSIDGSSEALLVLATDNGGEQLWTAASYVVLVTRGGRIFRTIGLPRNRTTMMAQGGGDLPPLSAALRAPYQSVRVVDMPDIGAYAVTLNCRTQATRLEMVTILGTAMATMRVDESCQSRDPRWQFTDSYWIDRDTGFVWRSLQHLHPRAGRFETKILRPPE